MSYSAVHSFGFGGAVEVDSISPRGGSILPLWLSPLLAAPLASCTVTRIRVPLAPVFGYRIAGDFGAPCHCYEHLRTRSVTGRVSSTVGGVVSIPTVLEGTR